MNNHEDECTRLIAAKNLGVFCSDDTALNKLINILNMTTNKSVRQEAAESIAEILMRRDAGDAEAIGILLELISLSQEGRGALKAIESLGKIGVSNIDIMSALLEVFLKTKDEEVAEKSYDLLKIYLKDLVAPETIKLIKKKLKLPIRENDFKTYYFAGHHGWGLDRKYLNNYFKLHEMCHSLIWIHAQKMIYPDFWIIWNT
jgi:hypothetical protein